jgi:hypothetical protein
MRAVRFKVHGLKRLLLFRPTVKGQNLQKLQMRANKLLQTGPLNPLPASVFQCDCCVEQCALVCCGLGVKLMFVRISRAQLSEAREIRASQEIPRPRITRQRWKTGPSVTSASSDQKVDAKPVLGLDQFLGLRDFSNFC